MAEQRSARTAPQSPAPSCEGIPAALPAGSRRGRGAIRDTRLVEQAAAARATLAIRDAGRRVRFAMDEFHVFFLDCEPHATDGLYLELSAIEKRLDVILTEARRLGRVDERTPAVRP